MEYTAIFYLDGAEYAKLTSTNEDDIWQFTDATEEILKNQILPDKFAKPIYGIKGADKNVSIYYDDDNDKAITICWKKFDNTGLKDFDGNDIYVNDGLILKEIFDAAGVSENPLEVLEQYLVHLYESYDGTLYFRPYGRSSYTHRWNKPAHISISPLIGDKKNICQVDVKDYIRINMAVFNDYHFHEEKTIDFEKLRLKDKMVFNK